MFVLPPVRIGMGKTWIRRLQVKIEVWYLVKILMSIYSINCLSVGLSVRHIYIYIYIYISKFCDFLYIISPFRWLSFFRITENLLCNSLCAFIKLRFFCFFVSLSYFTFCLQVSLVLDVLVLASYHLGWWLHILSFLMACSCN